MVVVNEHLAGFDHELAPLRHGVPRVNRKVHQHLAELSGIDLDSADVLIEGDGQCDILAYHPAQQCLGFLDDFIDIQHFGQEDALPAEGQQLAGQCRGSFAGPVNRFEAFGVRIVVGKSRERDLAVTGITVSKLLKSWATPAANCPTASIFCAWRNWSSRRRRSEMS